MTTKLNVVAAGIVMMILASVPVFAHHSFSAEFDGTKRVTFTGTYNARPRVSPDGKQLAVLTLDNGAYRIGVQDLTNNTLTVLSKGSQDESPSFAPNGAMVILAGRERGRGVLQTVSIDGQTSARLNADAGEVREPVWGPFLP